MEEELTERERYEQRLCQRLAITEHDFFAAYDYAKRMIERGLFGLDLDDPEFITCHAFNTALVVAYARPFSNSDTAEGRALPRLPGRFLRLYSDPERALHDRLISERNDRYAHSDAAIYKIEVHGTRHDSGFFIELPFVDLTESDLHRLVVMLDKIHPPIEAERLRLQGLLATSWPEQST